jgi:hypothetical protein
MCVALDQGHAALCAVSDSTRLMLEERLTKRGIDVSDARTRGQYVYLDGVDVLRQITRNGRPDPVRFRDVVEWEVESLVNEYAGVWIYGELAAILWSQGRERGAIELDGLWASVAGSKPVVLCVAFPVQALSWPIVHQVAAGGGGRADSRDRERQFHRPCDSPRPDGKQDGVANCRAGIRRGG